MALQPTSKMDPIRTTRGDEPHDGKCIDTQTVSYPPVADQIDADDLFQALSNPRRRHVIRALADGPRDIGPIAREIAAVENDIPVIAVNCQQRKRAWIGLYQAHLDKLDDWEIVEWGPTGDTVAPGPAHAEALAAIRAVAGADDDAEGTSIVDSLRALPRGGA